MMSNEADLGDLEVETPTFSRTINGHSTRLVPDNANISNTRPRLIYFGINSLLLRMVSKLFRNSVQLTFHSLLPSSQKSYSSYADKCTRSCHNPHWIFEVFRWDFCWKAPGCQQVLIKDAFCQAICEHCPVSNQTIKTRRDKK